MNNNGPFTQRNNNQEEAPFHRKYFLLHSICGFIATSFLFFLFFTFIQKIYLTSVNNIVSTCQIAARFFSHLHVAYYSRPQFHRYSVKSGRRTINSNIIILQRNSLDCKEIEYIHSDHFYSASSSPLLLRSAPDPVRILCRSFTPKRHRKL